MAAILILVSCLVSYNAMRVLNTLTIVAADAEQNEKAALPCVAHIPVYVLTP